MAAAPAVREPDDALDPVEHRQSSLRTQIPMTSQNVNKSVAMIAPVYMTVDSVVVIPASLHLPRPQYLPAMSPWLHAPDPPVYASPAYRRVLQLRV